MMKRDSGRLCVGRAVGPFDAASRSTTGELEIDMKVRSVVSLASVVCCIAIGCKNGGNESSELPDIMNRPADLRGEEAISPTGDTQIDIDEEDGGVKLPKGVCKTTVLTDSKCDGEPDERWEFSYDNGGRLVADSYESLLQRTGGENDPEDPFCRAYYYNEGGLLATVETYKFCSSLSWCHHATYDGNSKLLTWGREKHCNGVPDWCHQLTYDETEKLVKYRETYTNAGGSASCWDDFKEDDCYSYSFTYLAAGKIAMEADYECDGEKNCYEGELKVGESVNYATMTSPFSSFGEIGQWDIDGLSSTGFYTTNSNDCEGNLESCSMHLWDEDGNPLETWVDNDCDGVGDFMSAAWTYDEDGNRTSQKSKTQVDDDYYCKYATYDSAGNMVKFETDRGCDGVEDEYGKYGTSCWSHKYESDCE